MATRAVDAGLSSWCWSTDSVVLTSLLRSIGAQTEQRVHKVGKGRKGLQLAADAKTSRNKATRKKTCSRATYVCDGRISSGYGGLAANREERETKQSREAQPFRDS